MFTIMKAGENMKLIKRIRIDGKEAKLLLLDDNKTVNIVFDNEIISSSAGETWNNIENEEWAQEGLLKIESERYIRKKNSIHKLKKMADECF